MTHVPNALIAAASPTPPEKVLLVSQTYVFLFSGLFCSCLFFSAPLFLFLCSLSPLFLLLHLLQPCFSSAQKVYSSAIRSRTHLQGDIGVYWRGCPNSLHVCFAVWPGLTLMQTLEPCDCLFATCHFCGAGSFPRHATAM